MCMLLQPAFFFHTNALRGEVNPITIFQRTVEKREQYSLRPNSLVFRKIEFYVLQSTGLVIWFTMHLAIVD